MISQSLLIWLGIISFGTFVISLACLPWLVSKIPSNYFVHEDREPANWKQRHPTTRLLILVVKNLLGWLLLIGGTVMVFLPGQGLLTMAMGLVLMDYPGKYNLERRIVSIPNVYKGLNWLRSKKGFPPLELPPK